VSASTARAPDDVWLVEQNAVAESWSNGLRIERQYEVDGEPRRYVVFPRGQEDGAASEERSFPAGIVYHTTESQMAPLEPDERKHLRLIGDSLLQFVRDRRCYHYLIDRFGRVWRVVKETDEASHAGYSVWADDACIYVNLNRIFLGVSVETQTRTGDGGPEVTPAQTHALRILTEMLRSRYRIPAVDCVTHAQVSVNPSNLKVGYHIDWAAQFPFAEIGLPDNYGVPVPSVWLFGFTYDPVLVHVTGARYWKGLLLGEQQMRQAASSHGLTPEAWRGVLSKRYRRILEFLKPQAEPSAESKDSFNKENAG
jgi:hypothetical protein